MASIKDFIQRTTAKPKKPALEMTTLIQSMFSSDTNIQFYKETLICPLSMKRITLPARSSKCTHLRCFDLKNFIEMNYKRNGWKCPICKADSSIDLLQIDEYFVDILNKVKNESTNEIVLLPNGKWNLHKPKDALIITLDDFDRTEVINLDSNPTTSLFKEIEIITIDDDEPYILSTNDENKTKSNVSSNSKSSEISEWTRKMQKAIGLKEYQDYKATVYKNETTSTVLPNSKSKEVSEWTRKMRKAIELKEYQAKLS